MDIVTLQLSSDSVQATEMEECLEDLKALIHFIWRDRVAPSVIIVQEEN